MSMNTHTYPDQRITNSNIAGDGALLNAKQAAQYLNLSESFIRKATAKNVLPYVKIGTRVLFRQSDLDAWIQMRSIPMKDEFSSRAEALAATVMLGRRKP
jgi:excisionase family DNA binding protein